MAEIEKQFTRLEAGVAALRRVQANLKRYRAAVLKAACEGRLVPTEAELAEAGKRESRRFETGEATPRPHPHRAPPKLAGPWQIQRTRRPRHRESSGRFPKAGRGRRSVRLCRVQGGFAVKSHRLRKAKGMPLVRISNLVNGRVQVSEDTVFLAVRVSPRKPHAFALRKGDVLIAMSGAELPERWPRWTKTIPALLNQRVGSFVLSSAELANAKFVSLPGHDR